MSFIKLFSFIRKNLKLLFVSFKGACPTYFSCQLLFNCFPWFFFIEFSHYWRLGGRGGFDIPWSPPQVTCPTFSLPSGLLEARAWALAFSLLSGLLEARAFWIFWPYVFIVNLKKIRFLVRDPSKAYDQILWHWPNCPFKHPYFQ